MAGSEHTNVFDATDYGDANETNQRSETLSLWLEVEYCAFHSFALICSKGDLNVKELMISFRMKWHVLLLVLSAVIPALASVGKLVRVLPKYKCVYPDHFSLHAHNRPPHSHAIKESV